MTTWTLILVLMQVRGDKGGYFSGTTSQQSVFLTKEDCLNAAKTITTSQFGIDTNTATLCYESKRIDVK